jgi:hypothetical protein
MIANRFCVYWWKYVPFLAQGLHDPPSNRDFYRIPFFADDIARSPLKMLVAIWRPRPETDDACPWPHLYLIEPHCVSPLSYSPNPFMRSELFFLLTRYTILLLPQTIDVKMVVIWCPQVVWQFQTPIRFPAVKPGCNSGIKSWKSTYLNELDVRNPFVVYICFTKTWRAETL